MIPPARRRSRQARRTRAATTPATPSTATWLPTSARVAASGAPSSAAVVSRNENGHTGASWSAGGVAPMAATAPRIPRARTPSPTTNSARRRIAGRPTVRPSRERGGRWTARFSAASASAGISNPSFKSRSRPYGVPTSPATEPTWATAFTVPDRASATMAASAQRENRRAARTAYGRASAPSSRPARRSRRASGSRSEEHTSELQSLAYLVCRLLLEKKKNYSSRQKRPHLNFRHYLISYDVVTFI